MITKEVIKHEIDLLDDTSLDLVYQIIKQFQKPKPSAQSLMAKL